MPTKVDFLLIGQGLAGSLLSYELQKAGASHRIIDAGHQGAASTVAAGIINPITGYRFVKSWLLDELLVQLSVTYRALEQELGIDILTERSVFRALFSAGEENDWLARTAQEGWSKYILESKNLGDFSAIAQPSYSQGLLAGAQVNVSGLVQSYRQRLLAQNLLIEAHFDPQVLEIHPDHVVYQDITAKQLVFCEGYRGKDNPWFSYLPFEVVKGEVFILKIPDFHTEGILKHKLMLAPHAGDHYWLGSNYEHQPENDKPSLRGRQYLEKKLPQMLQVPYEEVEHLAAIRPATNDRRPYLGRHPEFPALAIFNGLGAKGSSLGPYFARQMTEYLLHDHPIHPEADIARYK